MAKGVRVDQYAAIPVARRQRCENRYLLNDWATALVGDKPECENHKMLRVNGVSVIGNMKNKYLIRL